MAFELESLNRLVDVRRGLYHPCFPSDCMLADVSPADPLMYMAVARMFVWAAIGAVVCHLSCCPRSRNVDDAAEAAFNRRLLGLLAAADAMTNHQERVHAAVEATAFLYDRGQRAGGPTAEHLRSIYGDRLIEEGPAYAVSYNTNAMRIQFVMENGRCRWILVSQPVF